MKPPRKSMSDQRRPSASPNRRPANAPTATSALKSPAAFRSFAVSSAVRIRCSRPEASQTQLCAYLSVALLVGLHANALFGWWWADPLAALAIAAIAFKEARESWRGEGCCDAC
jgi:hypothetical protein